MKHLLTVLALFLLTYTSQAQDVWMGTTNEISFFSKTAIEDIVAKSTSLVAAMNIKTKKIFFKVKNTSFIFPKALMQEHFNENYMESEKYPFSDFNGVLIDSANTDLTKDGAHEMWVAGKLNIHGVTKEYKTKVSFFTKDGKIRGVANFKVRLDDHKIERPSLVAQSLAEVIDIKVDCTFEVSKK
jgi:YceI-like domain